MNRPSLTLFRAGMLSALLVGSCCSVVLNPKVTQLIEQEGSCNVLITFKPPSGDDQATITELEYEDVSFRLKSDSARSQRDFLETFEAAEMTGSIRKYSIVNAVAMDGVTLEVLAELIKRTDLLEITSNQAVGSSAFATMFFDTDSSTIGIRQNQESTELPIQITRTGADKVWDMTNGNKGEGIVVAVVSTGVNFEHEALVDNYRGNNGNGTFSHAYNWYDSPHPEVGSNIPYDSQNIGTHLTGTLVGNRRDIGVAPNSKFIHCKTMVEGWLDKPEWMLRCLEWILAPTDLSGENPMPNLRPDIVVIPSCESCLDSSVFDEALNALIAAGVMVISPSRSESQGFPPGQCASISLPPGQNKKVLTVTAIDNSGVIIPKSALGPAISNGVVEDYIKPNVVCIGSGVLSSVYIDGESLYFPASESTVAGSITAGVVALLWDILPDLKGNVECTIALLQQSADPTKSSDCMFDVDGDVEEVSPNFTYGHGEIQAKKAYDAYVDGLLDIKACTKKVSKKKKKKVLKKKKKKKKRKKRKRKKRKKRKKKKGPAVG